MRFFLTSYNAAGNFLLDDSVLYWYLIYLLVLFLWFVLNSVLGMALHTIDFGSTYFADGLNANRFNAVLIINISQHRLPVAAGSVHDIFIALSS